MFVLVSLKLSDSQHETLKSFLHHQLSYPSTQKATRSETMKTNIEVDDALMAAALEATGLETTEKVIELALSMLVQIKRQEAIRAFRGKLPWEGNLDAMRTH